MPRLLIIVGLSLVMAACGPSRGGYYRHDGPPRNPKVNVSNIPDPVPRYERVSETGNDPYTVNGKTYFPVKQARSYRERGVASWYGRMFHGKRTSSGEPYDMYAMTAAHRTLPLPSYARVRNLRNGKAVTVRVNDRGPFLHNRLIDLSYAAAYKLDIVATGTGLVEVTALTPDSRPRKTQAKIPVTNKSVGEPSIYVQVGAFTQRYNAARLQRELFQYGYAPVTIQQLRLRDAFLHRVRVGPIATVGEADRIVENMQRRGYVPSLVVECSRSVLGEC